MKKSERACSNGRETPPEDVTDSTASQDERVMIRHDPATKRGTQGHAANNPRLLHILFAEGCDPKSTPKEESDNDLEMRAKKPFAVMASSIARHLQLYEGSKYYINGV